MSHAKIPTQVDFYLCVCDTANRVGWAECCQWHRIHLRKSPHRQQRQTPHSFTASPSWGRNRPWICRYTTWETYEGVSWIQCAGLARGWARGPHDPGYGEKYKGGCGSDLKNVSNSDTKVDRQIYWMGVNEYKSQVWRAELWWNAI